MATFKDKEDRDWSIVFDLPTFREVKKFGVDFLKDKPDPIGKLEADPMSLSDLLWLLCHEQAEKAQITEEQFQKTLGGEVFDGAIAAIEDAVIHFHATSKQPSIREQFDRNRKIRAESDQLAISKLQKEHQRVMDALSQRADSMIGRAIDKIATEDIDLEQVG